MNAPATQRSTGTDPAQLINHVQSAASAIERGDWVNAGLGIANTAMDIVGMASNPLSGFLSAGFSWAIQHVDFLREPFDVLLGNPEAIAKMAQSFRSAGQQVHTIANDYRRLSVEQTREWGGQAADGYRRAAQKHSGGLESLSKAANGVAAAVEGAGQLVGTVRKMIMDLIGQAVADMVMKIIQWLAASFLTFGAAIAGAIADIVSAACRYAKKLADFLQKLAGSLQKLMNLVKQVSQIAKVAEQVIQAISALTHKGAGGGGVTRPSGGGLGITEGDLDRVTAGANGQYSQDPGSRQGGTISAGAGGQVNPVYGVPGNPDRGSGYGPGGGGGGGHVAPVYTPPGGDRPGAGPSGGRWVPGRWEPADATAVSGGVTKPPSIGPNPTTTPGDWYRPAVEPIAASASGGGGVPKGLGAGGGGIPGAFGGGGGGTGMSTQHGGSAGVLPTAASGAAGGGGGGVPHGGGGAGGAGAGMMGGAPMAAAAGRQGGSGEHKRKVRIEGEALVEPPKAAKPIIGE